jgi:transcriptional regulator
MTVRRRMMEELARTPMTARDLSRALRISEKEVASHLEHVARSLRPPEALVVKPHFCHKCGFIFKNRRRYSSPSRCPDCRHEGIAPPVFRIEG